MSWPAKYDPATWQIGRNAERYYLKGLQSCKPFQALLSEQLRCEWRQCIFSQELRCHCQFGIWLIDWFGDESGRQYREDHLSLTGEENYLTIKWFKLRSTANATSKKLLSISLGQKSA